MTEPKNGQIYLCLKTQGGSVKGKHYVYYRGGELRTHNKRNVTCLSNGDDLLEYGKFELATQCPFCGAQTMSPFGNGLFGGEWLHDGCECAHEWDAKVKNYCSDCGRDTVKGVCPKCE